VETGKEARITLEANSQPDYRAKLEVELAAIRDSEMWRAGAAVRSLRPENWRKQ
jgi:ketol-acid reductoisomerase